MIKVISVMKKKKKLMLKKMNRKISRIVFSIFFRNRPLSSAVPVNILVNASFENGNTNPLTWSLDRSGRNYSWNAGSEQAPVMLETGINFPGFRVVNSNMAGIRAFRGDYQC
jgi:hypothetical protein